jgi:hypothetical protein
VVDNKTLINGLVVLAAGLLASSVSSFLKTFALFGTATDLYSGFFDGLAVVAFCLAIFVLVRSSRRPPQD